MDDNPYRSPQTESKPTPLGRKLFRVACVAVGILAIATLLLLLAIPMGMIRR